MDDLSRHIETEQVKARLERTHDAAVRAPLEQRIATLEAALTKCASLLVRSQSPAGVASPEELAVREARAALAAPKKEEMDG